jgi:hypothetical protein
MLEGRLGHGIAGQLALATAGQTGDCIGLIVKSYTTTEIVYQFGAGYPNFRAVTAGDAYKLKVWGTSKSGTVAYS